MENGLNCMNINDASQNLKRYLFTETLLNTFFETFCFCFESCIRIELEKNNGNPVSACCQDTYYKKYDMDYPSFTLLKSEREKRFGTPQDYHFENRVSPCEYHNPKTGCVLATHKSPICLAFMCRESIDELRDKYQIYEYDYLGMNYALEWILTGDLPDSEYEALNQSILKMTETIRNFKGNNL